MRVSAWLLVGWVALLGACGGRQDSPASVGELRRIAVVPVAGDTLELARVGRMPFAHRREQLNVSDWDLRDEAYRAVSDVLQRGGRFVVSRLDASPEVFPALHAAAGPGACRARDARREIGRLASACACDALLLIVDDRRQLQTDRPHYYRGFSWVGHGGPSGDVVSTEVVVALRAVLVDARSGRILAERRNDEPTGYPGLPRGSVETRWWPQDMQRLGDDERSRLEPLFVSLMQDTVRRALQGTGLLDG